MAAKKKPKKKTSKVKSTKHVTKRKKVSKTKKKYTKRDSKGRFVSSKTRTKKSVSKRKLKKTKRRDTKTKQRAKAKSKPRRKTTKTRKSVPRLKLIRKFFKVEPFRVKFFDVEKASASGYDAGGDPSRESYMGSSHGNTKDPELALPLAFEKAFIGSARKSGYFDDIDQIIIYRFGLIIRPRSGTLTDRFKQTISDILKVIPGISIHHVVEDEKTFSIRINLGSPIQGILSGVVSDEFQKYKSILGEVYAEFRAEYTNGVEWYSFWDTEENLVSH